MEVLDFDATDFDAHPAFMDAAWAGGDVDLIRSAASNVCAPASSQDSESQTRTVSAGGGVSPSRTVSKCA